MHLLSIVALLYPPLSHKYCGNNKEENRIQRRCEMTCWFYQKLHSLFFCFVFILTICKLNKPIFNGTGPPKTRLTLLQNTQPFNLTAWCALKLPTDVSPKENILSCSNNSLTQSSLSLALCFTKTSFFSSLLRAAFHRRNGGSIIKLNPALLQFHHFLDAHTIF